MSPIVTGYGIHSPGTLAGQQQNNIISTKLFDVLFWYTLERPMCYINQGGIGCQAMFYVNPNAPAYANNDLLGRKVAIFVGATFCWTSAADVS